MKIILSSAVLASLLNPSLSFSYLESLGSANPVAQPPPAVAAPSNGASYLDALGGSPSTPSGSGVTSYADDLSGGAAAPPPVDVEVPTVVVEVPRATDEPAKAALSGKNYMDALSIGEPVSGPGIQSYLDAVPKNAPVVGGAGITSYTAALPTTNTFSGTGSGMNTYTDSLSGGSNISGNFSPFGSSNTPSFSGTTAAESADFTLEATNLSSLVQGLETGTGTIRFTGSITGVSVH